MVHPTAAELQGLKIKINVLNETFNVGKEFISKYVRATICLRKQRLEVY